MVHTCTRYLLSFLYASPFACELLPCYHTATLSYFMLDQGTELAPKVDSSRLMLWGTSYSGGHVLVTASKLGDKVKAVVAQVRSVPGLGSAHTQAHPMHHSPRGMDLAARELVCVHGGATTLVPVTGLQKLRLQMPFPRLSLQGRRARSQTGRGRRGAVLNTGLSACSCVAHGSVAHNALRLQVPHLSGKAASVRSTKIRGLSASVRLLMAGGALALPLASDPGRTTHCDTQCARARALSVLLL